MKKVSIPDPLPAVKRAGMKSLWFPITDVSVPHDPADPVPLVREILGHLSAGDTIETPAQEAFVTRFRAAYRAAVPPNPCPSPR